MSQRSKHVGIEFVPKKSIKIKKEIAATFQAGTSHRKESDKYAIFRLYPNNNPKPSRIIGEIINKVFYIFYIDIDGKLYKH